MTDDLYAPEFRLLEKRDLIYSVEIETSDDITNLLQMTPFYWHSSQEKQAELMQLERLSLTISFVLSVWQKSA